MGSGPCETRPSLAASARARGRRSAVAAARPAASSTTARSAGGTWSAPAASSGCAWMPMRSSRPSCSRAEHSCALPSVAVIRTIALAAAVLLLGSAALAHQPDSKLAGAADLPATLVPGMGSLHHPVRTPSAEAQKFFDQGLSFVYAFNHPEAMRSFERAAQLDPQMAMAYWGIALALGSGRAVEIEDGVAYDEPPAW